MMRFDFRGKVAVVTGAGGGIGAATAQALDDAGATVIGIDLKPAPATRAGEHVQCDLADERAVEAAIAALFARHGRIDSLVNGAGVALFGQDRSLVDMDLAVFDRVVRANLKSMLHASRAVIPRMLAGGGGALVHVSSIQWMRGDPNPQDAYQATKAAMAALGKSLAMQYAAQNIRSNTISPGPTLTPMQARWSDADMAAVAARIPMRRVASAEEIARAILFLLSDAASYVTGIDLVVDGGMLMNR